MTILQPPPNYEVWLCTDLGEKITRLSPVAFDYVMALNDIGAFSLLLDADIDPSLLQVDRQIQFWRRHRGRHSLELDQVGFLRRWKYETDSRGATTIRLSGPDIQELLVRRVVAYASGTANAMMSKNVDNGIKDIFDTNFLGSATDGDRDISGYGVTVQKDLSDGSSIDKAFSWRTVLSVLKELNTASLSDGNEVFFRIAIVGIGADNALQLQFRTYTGQPGRDYTAPGVNMVFSLEHGNIVEPSLEVDHTNEINYVYAGGQGEGSDRTIAEVSDIARISKSVWNRREGFRDARNETSSDGVTDAGNSMLSEYRPRERFSCQVIDTRQTPYGSGWRLGDKIPVSYVGRQFDDIMRKVMVRVSGNSEAITGAFSGGRLITDPVIDEIIGSYDKLNAMINDLSVREDTKYRGTKASNFTTADLPQHGQYGAQTALSQIHINLNGVIRSITTGVVT